MATIYRGFDIEFIGGVYQIREGGKLIDDAASENYAMIRVDAILAKRRTEQVDLRR